MPQRKAGFINTKLCLGFIHKKRGLSWPHSQGPSRYDVNLMLRNLDNKQKH